MSDLRGSEWQSMLLEDLAAPVRNALVGGPFGSDLVSADYSPSGVPVIRGENLSLGRWVAGDFVFVSQEKAKKLAANTAGPLDIVFTQRGANHYRQVAVMPPDTRQRFVISQSQMKITVDRQKAEPLFVYYLFRSPEQQAYLQRSAIQTGVPHTNLSILKKTPLWVPRLATQQAIVAILSALDAKIELNQRMNSTLEATGRALFRSWFIDFDPVRARWEGRQPSGMNVETAALFPDKFESTAQVDIPAGWRLGQIDAIGSLGRQTVEPGDLASDTPYIGLEHMPRGSITLDTWETAAKVTSTKLRFKAGDVLFGKLRPYFRKVGVPFVDGVCSSDILVVTPKQPFWAEYLLLLLSQQEVTDYANAVSNGARMPRVGWADLARYPVVLPPVDLLSAFHHVTRPLIDRLCANTLETLALFALRDSLLPRLLSGQVRVGDAERLAGTAL